MKNVPPVTESWHSWGAEHSSSIWLHKTSRASIRISNIRGWMWGIHNENYTKLGCWHFHHKTNTWPTVCEMPMGTAWHDAHWVFEWWWEQRCTIAPLRGVSTATLSNSKLKSKKNHKISSPKQSFMKTNWESWTKTSPETSLFLEHSPSKHSEPSKEQLQLYCFLLKAAAGDKASCSHGNKQRQLFWYYGFSFSFFSFLHCPLQHDVHWP